MAWTNSKVFVSLLSGGLGGSKFQLQATGSSGDTIKAALYNNSITPDNTVSAANSAYNVGQWANTNEVISSTQWPAGGVQITQSVSTATTTFTFTASNTASGTPATISGAYGTLVYDTTVSSYGICYNYFGGSQSVTAGTFTIAWNASGIASFSVA